MMRYTANDIESELYNGMHGTMEFVPASDYDALASELEAVKAERDALAKRINHDGTPVDIAALCVEIDEVTDELARVKAESDALANSGALVPVRIEPKPIGHNGWFMTPTGLGWWGSDGHGIPCVETPEAYHDYTECHPVRLVPIAEWEARDE